MRIKNYPYGQPTKTLKKAVNWLNRNKHKIAKSLKEHGKDAWLYSFDYPDYWNMPKIISSRLDGDEVDWLQEETHDWWK